MGEELVDCRDKSLYRAKNISDWGYEVCMVFGRFVISCNVDQVFAKLEALRKQSESFKVANQESDGK